MHSYLMISVTFLQPACHARLGKEGTAPNEWPPSPLRLFQALVAAAADRWQSDSPPRLTAEPAAALRWLESLGTTAAPVIIAPRFAIGRAVPRYVPNNSAELLATKWAKGQSHATSADRTVKVFRPTHLLDGETVHYLWPLWGQDGQLARKHEPVIRAAARSIVALGWGIDSAVGDARIIDEGDAGNLPGERWIPGPAGTPGLRLPVPGTLDALIDRHARFLRRLERGAFNPVPPLTRFTTASYRREFDLPARPFAAFVLRPLDAQTGYAAFAPSRAACLAAMVRHVACRAARADLDPRPGGWRTEEWALRYVAGHGPKGGPKRRDPADGYPRFSYLPLPSIGHRYADGLIRRVIIAEPFGGDGRSARWALRRLAGEVLEDEQIGPVARLEPVEPCDPEFRKVFPLYACVKAGGSGQNGSRWASVTPVILPGFDDRKPAKQESLVLNCLRHAGLLEAVESVAVRRVSVFPKIAFNGSFRRPAYLQHLPAVHLEVQFRGTVDGPVCIGAGRHCGLGILAVEPQADSQGS